MCMNNPRFFDSPTSSPEKPGPKVPKKPETSPPADCRTEEKKPHHPDNPPPPGSLAVC